MLNLYDKLREIPLFQGLTSDNLMQIIGQTKFSFKKFGKNDIIKKHDCFDKEKVKENVLCITQ